MVTALHTGEVCTSLFKTKGVIYLRVNFDNVIVGESVKRRDLLSGKILRLRRLSMSKCWVLCSVWEVFIFVVVTMVFPNLGFKFIDVLSW